MSLCSRCGAAFGCAMADGGDGPCWCTQLPPVVPVPNVATAAVPASGTGVAAETACWCPACLKAHIAERSRTKHTD
ncbi:MAG TPA: hypothetical protein DDZ22_12800 [Massilia sp.]|jgi:hypothetical protein|nr:hypothetical protein [Massilia sp.]